MPYFVEIRLSPEQTEVPVHVRNRHLELLDENVDLVLAAGGLLDDSGQAALGGFYVVDVEEREAADSYRRTRTCKPVSFSSFT